MENCENIMKKLKYPECLLDINLKVVGKYKTSNDHTDIECLECGNIFNATPKSKMNNYKKWGIIGCPDCTRSKRYAPSRDKNIKQLEKMGFKLLSEYTHIHCYITVINLNCGCGRPFKTKANNLLNGVSYCRPCNDEKKRELFINFNRIRSEKSLKKLRGFKRYRKQVRLLSEDVYNNNKNEFTNEGELIRGRNKYHLDHIIPITFCYRNNIPEELCAHIDNLRLLSENENIFKKNSPSMGIPEIFKEHIQSFSLIENFINSIIDEDIKLKYETYKNFDFHQASIYFSFKNIAISLIPFELYSEKNGGNKFFLNSIRKKYLELGIRSIFVYEDEWLKKSDLILSKLKHILGLTRKKKIYARNCYIKSIDPSIKGKFLNKNHIQGNDGSNIKMGLFDKSNNELVSVMTLSYPRIFINRDKNNYNNNYEITRFASSTKYIVIGAFSKLLFHFRKNYEYDKIFSFADLRWSDGNLYHVTGFKLNDTPPTPDYAYIINGELKHRWNYRKDMIKEKFPHIYNSNKTEYEMMLELGYDRIWDCGKLKFEVASL
jgi:hypothetical protein